MDWILSWGKWRQTQCFSVRLSSFMSVMELHDPCVTLHLSLPTWPWLPRLELVPWSCIPLACQHLLGQVGKGLHKTWHWWGTWTGCPEKLLHPWKCSRMGWMGLEATWDSGRFPWPWQVGWNKMIFMIRSYWCLRKDISTQSILWFYECLQSVWVVPCLLCQVWLRPRVCSELQKVLSIEQSRDPTRVLRAECKARVTLVFRHLALVCARNHLWRAASTSQTGALSGYNCLLLFIPPSHPSLSGLC